MTALPASAQQSPATRPHRRRPRRPIRNRSSWTRSRWSAPFRQSLVKALEEKRSSTDQIDSIVAEDIAKFPDINLAESLQRIPGVAIDRDAGEGRQITVRGLGADFTRVRINGIEALATTGGTDSSGGANRSRGFDFNVFASELFSQLTVRKTRRPTSTKARSARPSTCRPRGRSTTTASSSHRQRADRLQRPLAKSGTRAAPS